MMLLFAVLAVFLVRDHEIYYTMNCPLIQQARAHSRRHDDGHSLGPLAFGLARMVVSVVLNPGILRRISR